MSATAVQLRDRLRALNPQRRFAAHREGHSVGIWVEEWGRFAVMYAQWLGGHWVDMEGKEVLTDGEPGHAPEDWIE